MVKQKGYRPRKPPCFPHVNRSLAMNAGLANVIDTCHPYYFGTRLHLYTNTTHRLFESALNTVAITDGRLWGRIRSTRSEVNIMRGGCGGLCAFSLAECQFAPSSLPYRVLGSASILRFPSWLHDVVTACKPLHY